MANQPLLGLKILDFSTLLPGPYASLMLADMGAEVLRVESPTRPDLVKSLPPLVDQYSAAHHYLNRGKQSIVLDLKQPESIEKVHQLIQQYDIIIEQFRPGVMQRLGLDYETLKAINPRLIYCSISSYGQTGPYRERAGHDMNFLAITGVASYTGRAGAGPLPLGIQVADIAGGSHHAIMGILAAQIQRQREGIGQHIDISMTDAALALNGMAGAGALASKEDPGCEQDWLNGGSFYDYYETQDQRYLAVGGLEPIFIQRLAEQLQEPQLLELVDLHNLAKQHQLKQLLKQRIKEKSFDEWRAIFAQVDCCVEPVLTLNEAKNHPQIQARRMIIQHTTETGVSVDQIACPIKFSH